MPKNALAPPQPNALDLAVQQQFGLMPNQDRLSILPRYSRQTGFVAPDIVYHAARGFVAPSVAAQGYDLTAEDALNTASMGMGGGAFGSAPKNSLRMMLGRNSQSTGAVIKYFEDQAAKGSPPSAKELAKFGLEQVPTAAGEPIRYGKQIPDTSAKFNMNTMRAILPEEYKAQMANAPDHRLPDVLKHPKLFFEYPELKDVKVSALSPAQMMAGYKGYFDGNTNTVVIPKIPVSATNAEIREQLATLLHEIQHKVQSVEEFPYGGSQSMFKKKSTDKAIAMTGDAYQLTKDNITQLTGLKVGDATLKTLGEYATGKLSLDDLTTAQKDFLNLPGVTEKVLPELKRIFRIDDRLRVRNKKVYADYQALAGEAQARATQKQFLDGKITRPLTNLYDVPTDSLIYADKFGNINK